MSETSSRRSDDPSEDPLAHMHRRVRQAAEPAIPGERVSAAIGRAARRLGLSYSRARSHWYGEARSVPAAEWLAVEAACQRMLKDRRATLIAALAALDAELEGNTTHGPRAAMAGERSAVGGRQAA